MLPFPWIPGELEETHPMCTGRAKPVSHSWRSPGLPVRWSWGGAGKREGEGQGKERRRPLSTSNSRGWFPQTRREIWLCYFSLEVNQWNSDVYLTSFLPSSNTKFSDVIKNPPEYLFSFTLIPANLKLAFSVLPFYLGGTLAGFLPADNKTLPGVHTGSVLPVQVGGLAQRCSWSMRMFQRAVRLQPGTWWFSWNL